MNRHFFRGALVVIGISTLHFLLQVVLEPSTLVSYVMGLATFIGLSTVGIYLWKKHHPWAGGFLASIIALYIFPVIYIFSLGLIGNVM